MRPDPEAVAPSPDSASSGQQPMSDQPDLFSPAVEHKQKAVDLLQRFAFRQAQTELETARKIDPYLADIEILLRSAESLVKLGINLRTKPSGLARAWDKVREARDSLPHGALSGVETLICQRVVQCLPPAHTGFVDSAHKTLHAGYCWLILNRPEQAHRCLLAHLTSDVHDSCPELWGYFGDTCYQLNRHEESNSGYLRALFTNAQAVDLTQLRHPDLQRIVEDLRSQHPEETARALLPIHGWMEGALHIPKGNTWLSRVIRNQRYDHGSQLLLWPAQRYHQFALCLYIDQSGLHGDIDFDARIEMERLDRELFQRYLEAVPRAQGSASSGPTTHRAPGST